ncbi:MAG: hypothetical protein IKL40_02330 [Clostridia bacterium]|nr:hypothetical protein [Clostridia bacterium]
MSGYDLYVFFLCLIVFVMFTALFTIMLVYVVNTALKSIRQGFEDDKIITEYRKEQKANKVLKGVCNVITTAVIVAILIVFSVSVYIQLACDEVTGDMAVPKVVLSSSMSYKNDHNKYLDENSLDDQFDTFDLIFTRQLPGEFELEMYDIVVYERYDELIIHRIVGIEEPNERHPDVRYFWLQGDAIKYPDEFPVLYSQMKAIYEGERIPYVGSFFAFMQSPAGYLCILLVIVASIATPIAEKKLWNTKIERLKEIGEIKDKE